MSLRTVVVTQDDVFYIPLFFRSFFDAIPSNVSIDSIVILDPFDESYPELAARMFRFYGPVGFVRLGGAFLFRRTLDAAGVRDYSVASLARAEGIDVEQRSTVNDEAFVESLRERDVDVVLSVSAPEVFDEQLLDAPRWCVNVHAGDLPEYRGMLPTFWALYHGEPEIGVTVHTMVEEIDQGEVLAKEYVDATDVETLDELIRRGKETGGRLAADVLDRIDRGEIRSEPMTGEGSYFSFPSRQERRELQRMGYELL